MSHTLQFRCEKALQAWKNQLAEMIIVCGGKQKDAPESEAIVMAHWFMEKGVPMEAILIEDKSMDTRENLKNARQLMEINHLKDAALCTSDYHLTRALWLAKKTGIDVCGLSAPTPLTLKSLIWGRLRETISWALYFFRMI